MAFILQLTTGYHHSTPGGSDRGESELVGRPGVGSERLYTRDLCPRERRYRFNVGIWDTHGVRHYTPIWRVSLGLLQHFETVEVRLPLNFSLVFITKNLDLLFSFCVLLMFLPIPFDYRNQY
jgi:hypothetical protein